MPCRYVLTALLLATRALAQGKRVLADVADVDSGNCGAPGQTLAVETDDGFDGIANCTTIQGSVLLHGYTNESNQSSMSLPDKLQSVQGGVLCSGAGSNVPVVTIQALGLVSVATQANPSHYDNGGLIIADYLNLTEFLFPSLSSVGSDLVIARNLQVNDIQFPSLTTVVGNLDISGGFNYLFLPKLQSVTGNINLQSSRDFDCPTFTNVTVGGFINCFKTTDPQPFAADNATTQINATATTSASGSASSASASASGSSKSSASKTFSFSTYLQFWGIRHFRMEVDASVFPPSVYDVIAYHNANSNIHFLCVSLEINLASPWLSSGMVLSSTDDF